MRFVLAFIFVFSFLGINNVFADTNTPIGFIENPIWFSKDSIVGGETVKIYTLIYNGSTEQLKGMVVFYNDKVVLGRREVIVPGKTVKDISVDWKPTAGTYRVRAVLENSRLIDLKGVEIKTVDILQETKENVIQIKEPELLKVEEKIKESGTEDASKTLQDFGTSLAEDIPKTASNIFDTIDIKREQGVNFFEKQKEIAKEQKDKVVIKNESVQSKKASFIPDNPFAIAKYYLFTLLLFLFNVKVIFFSLLILIIYFLLRFLYRKIRG